MRLTISVATSVLRHAGTRLDVVSELINFRYIANGLWDTDEAVARIAA